MFEATQGQELVVEVDTRPGIFLDLTKILSEKGIAVLAVCSTVFDDRCVIHMITDDNLRARDALTFHGFRIEEQGVVLLRFPHRPGMLKRIAETIAMENVEIRHLYASAMESQEMCLLVLHTSNDEHIIPQLNDLRPSFVLT